MLRAATGRTTDKPQPSAFSKNLHDLSKWYQVVSCGNFASWVFHKSNVGALSTKKPSERSAFVPYQMSALTFACASLDSSDASAFLAFVRWPLHIKLYLPIITIVGCSSSSDHYCVACTQLLPAAVSAL